MTPIPKLASLALALVLAPVASAHATFSVGALDQSATFYVTDTWGVVVETNGVPGPQPYGYYCEDGGEEGCYGPYYEECNCYMAPADATALPHVYSTCADYNEAARANVCLVPSGGVSVHAWRLPPAPRVSSAPQEECVINGVCADVPIPTGASWDTDFVAASVGGPVAGYLEATALCTTGLVCRVVLP